MHSSRIDLLGQSSDVQGAVEEIIPIYSICNDLLREIGFVDDKQCKMNAAEVMTVALVKLYMLLIVKKEISLWSQGSYREIA